MTSGTLHRASEAYVRSLRDHAFHRVLGNLGVDEEPVRVVLSETTIGDVFDRQQIARLDFSPGSGPECVDVDRATQFGMLVDTVAALHRDAWAELLEACVHAQTREFAFA